jgi:hypothetical protein
VHNLKQLYSYPFAGHSVLMGKISNDWQNTDDVLLRYGKRLSHARKKYRAFVEKG